MSVSKALQRLLRVRGIEEEQRRLALESSLGELHNLEHARESNGTRERAGRALWGESVHSGELSDRQAGLVQTAVARRLNRMLALRIAASETESTRLQQAFVEKRVEKRQAETLIEEAQAKEAVESDRRSQRSVDDWYVARKYHAEGKSNSR